MKKVYLSLLLAFAITISFAQIPAGYYDSATGLSGEALREALRSIITSGHTANNYGDLYGYYETTDNYGNNKVWDMYSLKCDGTANYWYYFNSSNECGTYKVEGDCYNREHSVPQSWFNSASPMVADLFIVYPTDGKVNGYRSNFPYGETTSPSTVTTDSSKVGSCTFSGYTGTIFEPIDCFKGDFARTYFYVATRYKNEVGSWTGNATVVFSVDNLSTFAKNLFLSWNISDPVSQKEIDRNNAVYNIQGNRNPYIDHPEWVECVWNNNCAGSVNPPSNLTATGVAISEIALTWSLNAANNDILLAYNTTNTFGTPSGTYTAGNTISGGGTVLSAGNSTSFSHTGLSAQTYYYKIWSYDGTDYSYGITTTATPLISEPSNHVTNFAISNLGSTTIDLIWTDATGTTAPAAYLIKANLSGSAINPPVDGQPEADGTFSKNIIFGTESVTFNNLNPNTSYDFEIFPYTNSGASIDYKTDGTVPSATGTTTDVPVNCGNETFDGLTTGSSSYLTVNWIGQDGSQWTATDSRTDQNIGNGAAICVRNGYVESGSVPNGISDITISAQRVYSGGSGNITVKINGNSIGTIPYSDVLQTNSINNINISGDIVLRLETPGNGDRIIIDDIIWTCNGGSSGNTLPEFTSTPVISATSGQTYTYNITATDADGDNLTFTTPTKPAWLTLTDNGNGTAILSGTPSNSNAGNNLVSISVSDGTGNVNQNFTVVVTAVNTAPQFTSTPVTTATAGQTYTYNITATDADGDNLTFTASAKPAWLTLTDNGNGTAVLSGTPSNSDAGNHAVTLSVSDGTESVNQDFTINVTEASSVYNKQDNKINIYPNPAKNSVNIISPEKIISIKLKNILGKTIINLHNLNTNTFILNLNDLSKGIYFMEITNVANTKILKKLIKE
ncbi:MAG: T9SS type A sorting domain-containing protein [Chlorobi bacterium]|nr:T9SS type A sorting domain-containing protein [Chlorobiota bacterium]